MKTLCSVMKPTFLRSFYSLRYSAVVLYYLKKDKKGLIDKDEGIFSFRSVNNYGVLSCSRLSTITRKKIVTLLSE